MATRTGLGATAAAATRACCSSTERTTRLSPARGPHRAVLVFGQAQSLYQPPPLGSVVVALQCKVNRSLEVPAGISQVVSRSAMNHHVHRMAFFDEQRNRVGQLNLATRTAWNTPQRIENRAIEHVTAGRRIWRWRILGL